MHESTKELQALSSLINNISRINSLDDVVDTALLHLTTSEVFNFHYAVFSEINYLDDLIQVKRSICNNNNIVDPIYWRNVKGSFPLKGSDVMAVAIREDRIIEAKGAKLDYEGSTLEMDVFNAFNHQYLIRPFVPVKSRRSHNNKDSADINMGLIEVGCHLGTTNDFEIDKKIKLGIYADNLGQSLRIIIEKEIQQKVIKIQKDSERFSNDNQTIDSYHHGCVFQSHKAG